MKHSIQNKQAGFATLAILGIVAVFTWGLNRVTSEVKCPYTFPYKAGTVTKYDAKYCKVKPTAPVVKVAPQGNHNG